MAEPVVIKAEPATLQVRTAAMSVGSPDEHVLVIGQAEQRGAVVFHGGCSCGAWSASHHPSQESIKTVHAKHVAKRKEAANG